MAYCGDSVPHVMHGSCPGKLAELRPAPLPWTYDDGGRAAAGFKGDTGDCAVRAIAIATGTPYRDLYEQIREVTRAVYGPGHSPRHGMARQDAKFWLEHQYGWRWTPTMGIGTGCTVHLAEGELPAGRLVCSLSKHFCTVIDGVVHDTHDPSRDGTRCVYGYWQPGGQS